MAPQAAFADLVASATARDVKEVEQAKETCEVTSFGDVDFTSDSNSDCRSPSRCSTADTLAPPTDNGQLAPLVAQLRQDNKRLQAEVAESQREVERLTRERNQEPAPDVDFSHILALARELNEDFEGGADALRPASGAAEAEFFMIHSPRAECDRGQCVEGTDGELMRLRCELERSRAEVAELSAHYAARDADLRAKFQVLMAAVCPESQNSVGGFESDSDGEQV